MSKISNSENKFDSILNSAGKNTVELEGWQKKKFF